MKAIHRYLLIVLTALLVITAPLTAAIASDISGAAWLTRIIATNNGSAATNAWQTLTLSTADMITAGMADATVSDVAIRTSGGTDVAFQPSANSSYPWAIQVPSVGASSQADLYMYSGGATGGKYRYFPGPSGANVTDHSSLELGDNFTLAIAGFIDATQAGNLLYKPDAFALAGDGSGNVTASIYGTTENVTDTTQVGTYSLYSGSKTRAGQRLNSFPEALIENTQFNLKKTGTPTGTATVVVRRQSDDAVLATLGTLNVSTLTTSFVFYNFTTDYYHPTTENVRISFEYASGNASSYVSIGNNTGSGIPGTGFYYDGTYTDEYDINIDLDYRDLTQVVSSVTATGVTSEELTPIVERTAPWFAISTSQSNPIIPRASNLIFNAPLWQTDYSDNTTTLTSIDAEAYNFSSTNSTWTSTGYQFNGTNGKLLLANAADIGEHLYKNVTISVWPYPATGIANSSNPFSQYGGSTPEQSFSIAYSTTSSRYDTTFRTTAGATAVGFSATNSAPLNTWTNYTITYNGSTTQAYINGVASGAAIALTGNLTQSSNPAVIGSRYDDGTNAFPWTGRVGEAQVWDATLSPAEILAFYNATRHTYDGSTGIIMTSTMASVPDTTSNWTIAEAAVMPYMEYAEITVDGVQAGYWDWAYGTTFPDDSVNSNTMTPSFRTASSDADVTLSILSQTGLTLGDEPTTQITDGWTMVGETPTQPAGLYTEGGTDFPGATEIQQLATDSGVPYMWWMVWVAFGSSIAVSVWVYGKTANMAKGRSGSLFAMWLTFIVCYTLWFIGGGGVVPGWPLIPIGVAGLLLMVWFNPFKTAMG